MFQVISFGIGITSRLILSTFKIRRGLVLGFFPDLQGTFLRF